MSLPLDLSRPVNEHRRNMMKNNHIWDYFMAYCQANQINWQYLSKHTSVVQPDGDWRIDTLTALDWNEARQETATVLSLIICNHCLEVVGLQGADTHSHHCMSVDQWWHAWDGQLHAPNLNQSVSAQDNPLPLCTFE